MKPPDYVLSPNLKTITLMRDTVENWNVYPFNVPVVQGLSELRLSRKVCFFVGENGSGKSTLIEAIAQHCGFNREGGSRNTIFTSKASDAYAARNLADCLRLSWTKKLSTGYFLRAESFFNVATYLDDLQRDDPLTLRAYGDKSLHQQSHGEAFLALFRSRFSRSGLYLVDEPEAALSPQRQLSLLVLLHNTLMHHDDVQFIIATHSPIITAYPDAQILSFSTVPIREITYKETEAYRITGTFLTNPEAFFRHLFESPEDEHGRQGNVS